LAYTTSDLNSESQHAALKNLGCDHILTPSYLKKTELFFSFGYNQFNHTRRGLRNEQLSRQLNASSSRHKEALQHMAIVTGHPPVLPTASASLPATRVTPRRSLGHCYVRFAHPELSLTMKQALSFRHDVPITSVLPKICITPVSPVWTLQVLFKSTYICQ